MTLQIWPVTHFLVFLIYASNRLLTKNDFLQFKVVFRTIYNYDVDNYDYELW